MTLLIIILVWSLIWKAIALWKSARNTHFVWFIVFLLVHTVGILEILYIFVFSKLSFGGSPKKSSKKPSKSKTKKKSKKTKKRRR